jgi:hypothetical protein
MTGRRRSQTWLTRKLKISKGIVMRPEGLRPATRKAAAAKDRGRGAFRTRLASGKSRAASGWPPWRASTTRPRHRAGRTM